MAGGDEVVARLEAVRRGRLEGLLLVIAGGGQFGGPFQRGFAGEDFPALLNAQVLGPMVALLQEDLPINRNSAEIDCVHIPVADVQSRTGVPLVLPGLSGRQDACPTIPHPLGRDAGGLRLDLRDHVAAELAARRLREQLCAPRRELVRRDEVALLLQEPRLTFHCQRGDFVVRVSASEGFQGRPVTGVLILAKGSVPAPRQPVQVSGSRGQLRRRIALMEAQQVLVKPDGLQFGRFGVARPRLPGHELRCAVENRAVG